MFFDGMMECSDKTKTRQTMTSTTASNYWTATAHHVMPVLQRKEQHEEERWNQHKFGLCHICKVGLNDRADFTFNYTCNKENGTMMCFDCDAKVNLNKPHKLKLD
jgi:hypothetical protein